MTNAQWTVGDDESGLRLDKFLAAADRLGSRPRAALALERGKVSVNGAEVDKGAAARRLASGDSVSLWVDRPGSAKRRPRTGRDGDLDIVYEDDVLLVVNKPAGLLTVPLERKGSAPSLYDQVTDRFRSRGKRRPFVVHRIDQDTSGLVVFAKDASVRQALQRQFKRREPERIYRAIVYGHPHPAVGTWRDHLVWDARALIQKKADRRDPQGTEAISDYRVIETFDRASHIEVRLRTGRRNQIRMQAHLRGHSLVGEKRYVADAGTSRAIPFERHALHAYRVSFTHPVNGGTLELEATLPADFNDLLARLRRRRQGSFP
jgi:23S rRNA pseudouridine1911/1915/1917 synthase